MRRDVGLHREQGPGGGRERAVVGDRHERGELADVHQRPRGHLRDDSRYLFVLLVRSCACAYTHKHNRSTRYTPHVPLDGTHEVDPPSTGFRLRGPAPPAGLLPFSGRVADRGAYHRRRDRAPRSSTSTGRCSPARRARCSRRRCAPPASRRAASRGRRRSTACSTASARRGRRWRSPARAANLAKGRSRAAMVAAGEAAADGLAAMVQPFAGRLFEEHRAAGRPIVLATTTPYDLVEPAGRTPRPRRRRRHPLRRRRRRHLRRHARRPVRVGRRQARGRQGLGRRPRRRPGGELCLLGQLLRRAAAVGGRDADRRQPRPADGRARRSCGAGRSSTSTCRRAW